MYGTVARMHLKSGMHGELAKQLKEFEAARAPGYVRTLLYQTDADPDKLVMVAVFQDKAAYVANAQSPQQDARYQKMRALLTADPEWTDGEVIYEGTP